MECERAVGNKELPLSTGQVNLRIWWNGKAMICERLETLVFQLAPLRTAVLECTYDQL